jgi:Pyruvate/2-oxoacid:ferredoxin oxidoreductase gamma subunit
MRQTFAIGIGGAAGQGVATPGDLFAKIFSRRGLHLNAYNAYQSIIRGGHTFLTISTGPEKVSNMGDRLNLLIPLNQDAMDRHLRLLTRGAACIYNSDTIKPGVVAEGVALCALPVSKLADITRNKVAQNTLAVGAGLSMMSVGFQALEEVLAEQFKKKGEAVVSENVGIARVGRLIDLRGLGDIQRESPGEFVLALITAAVVVLVGVEQGIVLAMVLSLLRIVRHSYRPHTGVLVAAEGGTWRLLPAIPGAMTEPGLVMYRFGAALFYANVAQFAEEIRNLVGTPPSPIRWLVVDAEAITQMDYTAARVVRQLHQELVRCGVELAFARVSSSLKADVDRHRLTEVIGLARLFDRLHDALAAFGRQRKPTSQPERDS